MTDWELLDLSRSELQMKTKWLAKRKEGARSAGAGVLWTRIAALSAALVLFALLQVRGVWADTPLALGIFSQGLGMGSLDQDVQPAMSYALTYTQGQGFAFQKMEDTLIRVRVDGATVITEDPMPHLKQILDDASVTLEDKDRAQATMTVDSQGNESMPEIDVTRVRDRIVYETEPIPSPVTWVDDAYLAPGQSEVRSPGRPGVLLKKYDVTTENDVDVSRRQTGSELVQQPVPQVIACGIKTDAAQRLTASRGSGAQVTRTLQVTATAYTRTGYKTASGVWPYVGGVAVDPAVIPIGSKIYIDGYGPARAVDTGGLIKGNRIDLFFDTESECQAWGRRSVTASIME
jgi:3D (Asp-Asp-Asp) domain-containing protein